MAALTGAAKRSPTMRMSGPVIWMTKGLSASAEVSSMAWLGSGLGFRLGKRVRARVRARVRVRVS